MTTAHGGKWMKQGNATTQVTPAIRARHRAKIAARAHRLRRLGTPHALKMARKLIARAA